jgi:hypothetical protein
MKRPLIYLGIVLVIAVVVFLIERPDKGDRGDVSGEPAYPNYDARRVERIELGQLLSGVQLKKDGGRWMVAELITPMRESLIRREGKEIPELEWHHANKTMIGGALGVFGQFPKGVVVSNNPVMQMNYQVAEGIGLSVRLYDEENNKMVDVVIGKHSPDMSSNYVRVDESNDVMLTDRVIDNMFPTAVAKWRDNTIWRVDPKAVEKVSVWRPKGSYEIAKDEGGKWLFLEPRGKSLDQEKVKNLVGHLALMRAAGFASSDDPKSKFKHPSMKLSLDVEGGDRLYLELGGSNNLGQHYARVEGSDQVYLIGKLDSLIGQSLR